MSPLALRSHRVLHKPFELPSSNINFVLDRPPFLCYLGLCFRLPHLGPLPTPIAPVLTGTAPRAVPGSPAASSGSRSRSSLFLMRFLTDPRAPDSVAILFSRRNTGGLRLDARQSAPHKINPLECALTSKHRVLPGFGQNCRRPSPLECAVAKTPPASPLECALTKKWGRGASLPPANHPSTIFCIFFQVPYPLSRLLTHSYENYRGGGAFFPFWNSSKQASRHAVTLLCRKTHGSRASGHHSRVSSSVHLPELQVSHFEFRSRFGSPITNHSSPPTSSIIVSSAP